MTAESVTHPRFAARRGVVRLNSWWARAWLRGIEESAYAEGEIRTGRRLARSGGVGGINVGSGSVIAAVSDRDDLWSVRVLVPTLDPSAIEALVELVAAQSGRISALLAGELPLSLSEEAEEAGVELVPYGGELTSECTCGGWTQPCPHALAVLTQTGWLVDRDPLTLMLIRGVARDDLLTRLHELTTRLPVIGTDIGEEPADEFRPDLDTAYDAAMRAARALEHLTALDGSDTDVAHLL